MSRKQRKSRGGNVQQLQDLEIAADMANQRVTLGAVKQHLTEDLNKGMKILGVKGSSVTNLQNNIAWDLYLQNETKELSNLGSNSAAAAIGASISGYNVYKRQRDHLNPYLTRTQKSKYPCGSITCKERGQEIKDALYKFASYSPESLGRMGMKAFASNATDWTAKAVGIRSTSPTQKSWFSWGNRDRVGDKLGGKRTRKK
jgi:hypothetical protein